MTFPSLNRNDRLLLLIALASAFFYVSACSVKNPVSAGNPAPIPSSNASSASEVYKKGNWIPLLEPDSRFVPGTIFMAKSGEYPRWLSSLASCGVPADVLTPVNSSGGDFSYTGTVKYDAKAALSIKGVSIGPDFNKASTATFDQSDTGPSAIDVIKAITWVSKPENSGSFSSECKVFLTQPDTFIAQESYRVGKGKYTFKDDKGAKLDLGGLNFKIISLTANADAEITADSTLQLTVPVYTAVHEAIYANNIFQVLGQPASKSLFGDEAILKNLPNPK